MSLRELVWMATGRQRAEWERVGRLVWGIRKYLLSKEPVTPETVIPEQYRTKALPARELTEEEKAMRRRRFWAVVDNAAKKV